MADEIPLQTCVFQAAVCSLHLIPCGIKWGEGGAVRPQIHQGQNTEKAEKVKNRDTKKEVSKK